MVAKKPDPTPEQIRRMCAEIRAGWSDAERAKRWMGPPRVEWTLPAYVCDSDGFQPDNDVSLLPLERRAPEPRERRRTASERTTRPMSHERRRSDRSKHDGRKQNDGRSG